MLPLRIRGACRTSSATLIPAASPIHTRMNATESTELQAASTSSEPRPRAPLWASAIATFFGTGKLRPGPGTWASAATTLLWGVVAPRLPQSARTPVAIATAAAVTAIGIPAATRVARALGKKDPSQVVIDEVAGQMIAMIGVPLNWQALLASLI